MIIEEGKYYLTRDGRIAGPARRDGPIGTSIEYTVPLDGHPATYWESGRRFGIISDSEEDLVREYTPCP